MAHEVTVVARHADGEEELQWLSEASLMEVLRDNGLPIMASCGGCASCATCHVHLAELSATLVGERSELEEDLLELEDSFDPEKSRLSCQIERPHVACAIVLTIPEPWS